MAKKKTINMVKSQVIYKDYSKDAERTALVSGENLSHMFGKIARWYTDISWVGHTHTEANITDFGTYAGASTKGGAATSANKLNIGSADIGSETKPVYFSYLTGKPVACTYSLNASVPANAVFTDINVKQSPSTANESREVLFAGNTGNTETTGTVGKSNKLYFNPSTGALTATSFSGSMAASNLTGTIDAGRLPTTAVTAGSYGPAAGGTLTYGGTFDVPYVTVDKYGRLTAGSTKTFTMPAQYTHPTYTSKTSAVYKITVDNLGHVSAATSATAADVGAMAKKGSCVNGANYNDFNTTGFFEALGNSDNPTQNAPNGNNTNNNFYVITQQRAASYFTQIATSVRSDKTMYIRSYTNSTWSDWVEMKFTDTVYTHPTYTEKTNGLYKITVDSLGHVSATAAVTASDLPAHTHSYLPLSGGTISSSSFGPLVIKRTGSTNGAGIKFYNQNGSTDVMLGAIGMASSANGGLVRWTADLQTSYTVLDTGNFSISRSLTSGTKIATITVNGTATDLYCQTNTNTTYTIATGDSNGQIKVTPSSGSAYNVSVKGLGSAAYTASSDYATSGHNHTLSIAADSGTSVITLAASTKYKLTAGGSTLIFTTPPNTNTTYSAGTGLALDGTTFNLYMPRVTKDCNEALPGINKVKFEEFSNSSTNIPSAQWYHITTMEGEDSRYATQLALGMTTTRLFYRNYSSSSWSAWKEVSFSDHTHNYIPNTAAGLSAAITLLDTGNSIPVDDCYYITQTNDATNNTYYRRKHSILWSYIKGKADSVYAPISHTHKYAGSSTPGGPALSVSTKGDDVVLGTANSSTNDSGDIVFLYGNGSEKMRIWTNNDYSAKSGPLFRVYNTSGTMLYNGTLVLGDGTGASGTWSIIAASANKLNTNAGSATNPVYFSNGVPVACSYSLSRDILRDYTVTSSNTANYPYHLLCYMKDTSPGYKDFYAIFRVTAGFDGQISGVYEVTVRMNSGSAGSANLRLISGYPFRNGLGNVVMGYSTAGSNTYAYVFLVCGTYARTRVRIIHNGSFTFNDTNEAADTTSSDKKGSVNVYASLASAGTALVGGSFANTQTTLGVGNIASSISNVSVGGQVDPVYFSNGVPVKCKTVGDNGYFTNVAIIGSDGVMEIGKYIDMHLSNGSSNDYDYRITNTGTNSIEFDSREANNTLKLYAPSGYTRLSFQTAESNKAYTASGITVYPLTASGSTMVVETGGNMIVGGGEAASALYTNDFDNCKTQEKESLYLAADASILFVSNTQTFANRTCMVWESLGCLRPLSNNTLSIGRADYYWNKAYIKLIYGGSNGSWIMGRDNAVVINNTVPAGDSYAPVIAVKTNLGSWTAGSLGSSAKNTEHLYFSYTTDANYNAGTNASNNYYLTPGGWFSGTAAKADKWTTARTLTIGSTGKSVDGSGNVSWSLSEIGAAAASHTHSYLPLAGGTMTGDITFTGVTSTSYPATSCKLYWTGSTDWAKIYYRVDASDAGRLVFDIGDDTNTRIDFAYNGTTKSYIDTSGNFSGNAATSTTATNANYVNIVATNEIRFNASTKPSSAMDLYIGYTWSDGNGDAKINSYIFQNGNRTLTKIQAASIYLGNTSGTQGAINIYNSNNKLFSIVASPDAQAGYGITLPPTGGLMTDIVYKASSGVYGALGKVENTGCIASLTASDISSHTSRSSSTQSFGGTYTIGSTWYNMLSIRHRNGSGDGGSYGFYIRNSLTSSSSLVYNQQYNGSSWRGEATIVDSLNVSSYAVPNTQDGMNAAINKLSTGDSDPQDNDYYVAQYAGGGTTTTSYHRRKHSSLFSYIKGKLYKILWSGSTSCTARSSTSITLTTSIAANKYRFIKIVWNVSGATGVSEIRADTLNAINNVSSASGATTTNIIQFTISSDGKKLTVGPGTTTITVIQIAGVYPI